MSGLPPWLYDDGPAIDDDARAALGEAPVPAELAARTLDAVRRARAEDQALLPSSAPANQPWRVGGVVALAGLAAGALLAVRGEAPVGDPAAQVARGDAESAPMVHLKLAARRGGQLERLRDGAPLAPGDELMFRVQLAADGWVALVRADAAGVKVLHVAAQGAGEEDLRLGAAPLAWSVDPGDQSGVFAVLSASEPLGAETLNEALADLDPSSPTALCRGALALGYPCDAAYVEVRP
ncbi:hypothetical protein L6R49_01155 [Myxococcota bacterium]|nr:hypothetical protein [Myxococcota bacterium]